MASSCDWDQTVLVCIVPTDLHAKPCGRLMDAYKQRRQAALMTP
jgi:hypothetical protein